MKKPREFHDNESENISYPVNLSVESELLCRCGTNCNVQSVLKLFYKRRIGGAALIRGRRLLIFLSQMRRLFEGGA